MLHMLNIVSLTVIIEIISNNYKLSLLYYTIHIKYDIFDYLLNAN